jgi:predicted nucleotidyltransferase
MTERIRIILADFRKRLEELYGDRLDRLVLFGSQARGDAEPDSDIDMLVVLKGQVVFGEEMWRTNDIRGDVSLEYNTVVSCLYMSTERFQQDLEEPLLLNVRDEGILV